MKLKCTNSIAPGDKQQPYFTKGKEYDGTASNGDVFITGDRARKSGSVEWQSVKAWPTGYAVIGVATFEEVK